MLPFFDISMHIKILKLEFISSQIEDMNLLNNPLSSGDEIIDEN